jgi:peptidoglycan hydrolase-like protein with peptidoglycan-binding domain
MDTKATNYSSIANRDNGACLYPASATSTAKTASSTATSTGATAPSFTPTGEVLGVSTYNFTRNLSVGARGGDVLELQKRLKEGGYYTGEATGYFGPITSAALKKYQTAASIEATGTFGPKTRNAFNQQGSVLGAATIVVLPSTAEARSALIRQLLLMIAELQKELMKLKVQGA